MGDQPTDIYSALKINVPKTSNPAKGASIVPPGMGELNYIQMLLAGLIDQTLYTTSSPTFAALTLSGLTASALVGTNASKQLQTVNPGTSLSLSGTALNTIQGIRIADTPQFTRLGLGIVAGAIKPLSLMVSSSSLWAGCDFFDNIGNFRAHFGWGNSGVGTLANSGYFGTIGVYPIYITTNDTIRFTITGAGLINCIENVSLGIADTNKSHFLRLVAGSDLTADRNLTFTTGDAARTITLSGNPTLNNWFDQGVKVADTPAHAAVKLTTGASVGKVWKCSNVDGSGGWDTESGGMANPMTTLGDIIFENATPAPDRLAGDTSNTRKFLRTLSVAGVAQAPAWDTIAQADVTGLTTADSPTFNNITLTNPAIGTSNQSVGLGSGAYLLRLGGEGGYNLIMDYRSIQGRNNGVASYLWVNPLGGNVRIGDGTLSGLAKFSSGYLDAATAADALSLSGIGQAWTTPTFDAANFTADGTMTWTVESGDVATYAYTIIGKIMMLEFVIVNTDIGGTPSSGLYIKIPGGKSNAKKVLSIAVYIQNGGGTYLGYIYSEATWTTLKIAKTDNSNFATGAGATAIYGQIFFEIS